VVVRRGGPHGTPGALRPGMKTTLLTLAMLAAVPAAAQEHWGQQPRPVPVLVNDDPSWSDSARFFIGGRTGVGVPPGGSGVAPTLGFEIGVSAPHGFGFGLHLIGMSNPPAVAALNIEKASWGVGAMADLRMYFQTVEPLTLYATLAGGFLAGPGQSGQNVVLPLINPGFGARVKFNDQMYVAFEFGAAGFFIPFVNLSVGWEPQRLAKAAPYAPPPGAADCVPNCPPPAAPPAQPTAPPAAPPA
jgi:hypothetical protein